MVVVWIFAPLLYYSNTFFSSYLPILDASVYNNEGRTYDISKILTPSFSFDEIAYHEYSNVYLPMTYALMYAIQFASMTALITHTVCHHGEVVFAQMRASLSHGRSTWRYSKLGAPLDDHDEQAEMPPDHGSSPINRPYDRLLDQEVPALWYLAIGVVATVSAMFVVE